MIPRPAAISIALTTFNGERFLPAQLASLASQSVPPAELVAVDDGSTDRTMAIIEEFSRCAPFPVRIFRNAKRLGYRENFMYAAGLCRHDLISFCDQDDVWARDKLARIAPEFNSPDVLMVYHNASLIDVNGRVGGYVFKRKQKSATLTHEDVEPWRVVPGFSQVIRRSLLGYSKLHGSSADMFALHESMPHDQWFLFLASALGKVRYLAKPLAQYRIHDQNTSGWLPAKPLAFALHNIAHASYYVRASHKALQNRMDLLEQLKQDAPQHAAHIDKVLAHYAHISSYVRRRFDLYTEKSLRVRVKLLIAMIRDRTYADSRVKFGRGSLLLDTCIGVPVGHTLR